MTKPRTIMVEGIMAHGGRDVWNGEVELEGVAYKQFLEKGYMTRQCSPTPSVRNIVGTPKKVTRNGDKLQLLAEVFDPVLIKVFERKPEYPMGCALAVKVLEREGSIIKRCDVIAVALVPASELSDPRCICRMVDNSEE